MRDKKEDHDTIPYCAMPWVHLHVSDRGMVKACCVANIPFGNVNKQSFKEIWNGEEIQQLRKRFKANEIDNRCKVCIQQEKAGAKSIREETWEKYPNLTEFPITTNTLPDYFDIRFSNLCNFRCRTCWHGASSKWHAESVVLKRTRSEQALIENIESFNRFIDDHGPALKQAKEIYFAGGEPLITEAHYQLLEWLIKHKATGCLLRYNTNLSVLRFKQYDLQELWSHFEAVEIMASIDAKEELGEFIRKEMDWEKVRTHCHMLKNEPHIKLKLAPTVSILSIYHLPDLYQWAIEENIITSSDFYFNILERPYHYNIKAFPQAQKKAISKKYRSFFDWCEASGIPESIVNGFQTCLDFMSNENLSDHWSSFVKETKTINALRNEKLMTWWYQDLELNK